MAERIHRWFGVLLWRGLMVAVVLLAVYVTGARALLRSLPDFSSQLVRELSFVTGTTIGVREMSGRMQGFSPEIVVSGLTLRPSGASAEVLRLEAATMRLDVWASILALKPRFDAIELNQPKIDWYFSDAPTAQRPDSAGAGGVSFDDFSELLQAFSRVSVNDGELLLTRIAADGSEISVPLIAQVELGRTGSERRIQARLRSQDGLLITIAGQGVGNPFAADASRGELHGTVIANNLDVLGQLFDLRLSGRGTINFWYQPVDKQPSWRVLASVDELGVEQGSASYRVGAASLSAAIERDGSGWKMYFQDAQIEQGGASFTVPRAQLVQETGGWQLRARDLDVRATVGTLQACGLFSGAVQSSLATLSPSGVITSLEARIDRSADMASGWWLQANVVDATTAPLRGIPGLAGIDAFLNASSEGATAWIDTRDFALDLPKVYNDPILFERVQGRLSASWQDDALFLKRGLLRAQSSDYNANVQFGMDIPLKKDAGLDLNMYLTVGIPEAQARVRRQFIPKTVRSELYGWLENAIPEGDVTDATFVWRGYLNRWNVPSQTMQLGLNLTAREVLFEPAWPPISDFMGVLAMDDERISVWAEDARMLRAAMDRTSVEVSADRAVARLNADTSVTAGVADVLDLLSRTPIAERAGTLLSDIDGTGRIAATLALGMDINRLEETLDVSLDASISDSTLTSTALDLTIAEIDGPLSYDLRRGFSSPGLQGTTLGVPLAVQIDPALAPSDSSPVFAGRFNAAPQISTLEAWLKPPVSLPWEGAASITVDVFTGDETQVDIRSDLVGATLRLPAPLGKDAADRADLNVAFAVGDDSAVDLFWEDRFSGQLYRRDNTVVGGSFDLTPRSSMRAPPQPIITSGYYVMGRLGTVDVEPWLSAIAAIDFPDAPAGERLDISVESMKIDEVMLGEASLGPVSVDLTPFAGWEMLGLNADWLDAELTLEHDGANNALIVNNLNLDRLPTFEMGGAEGDSPLSPPDLTAPIDVVIANLIHQDKPLGAASFSLESNGRELQLADLRGRLANVFFEDGSSFTWTSNQSAHLSSLTLNSRLGDVGDTLDQLGSTRNLETRRGRLDASLSWSDTPFNPEVSKLGGTLSLELREGSFLPVSGQATGALRILSVLNLAGLVSRANVNQLFEPGVTFDVARGELTFENGVLSIPDFVIEGSGGNFVFDSEIDLLTEMIDGELVVTLPLVSNIPWVAALAGGLPIAAGAYILSQVFEDPINRLSSGVYSVAGELNAPEVKFERIFDARSKQSRVRAETTEPAQ